MIYQKNKIFIKQYLQCDKILDLLDHIQIKILLLKVPPFWHFLLN